MSDSILAFLKAVKYSKPKKFLTDADDRELVNCPFHVDENPSFSVGPNYVKCFGECNKTWSLQKAASLFAKLKESKEDEEEDNEDEETNEPKRKPQRVRTVFSKRGLNSRLINACKIKHRQNGRWLVLKDRYGYEQKKDLSNYTGRFKNKKGQRSLFWISEKPKSPSRIWLAEGIFDAISVYLAFKGKEYVAAALGANLSNQQAFSIAKHTVFFIFDADSAGYLGAREAAKNLRKFGGRSIIIDMPSKFGKDPNDAWVAHRKTWIDWIDSKLALYDRTDLGYLKRLFNTKKIMPVVTTTIQAWDSLLKGGLRPGVHVIGAEPKAGKTALTIQIADENALLGKRVLLVEYEISKQQTWARLASRHLNVDWTEIEAMPYAAKELKGFDEVLSRASNIRIVNGWTTDEIYSVADQYDLIIVDYLQRMPTAPGKSEGRYDRVTENIRDLSNLGRDKEKIIIVVSELGRKGYANEITLSDFKESGAIEYVSQSVVGFKRTPNSDTVFASMLANTRGVTAKFRMQVDLGKQKFWSK